MLNPILQMLNQKSPLNNVMSFLNMAKGNPEAMFNNMIQNNPQFRQFVNENRGKSAEEIARNYGVDLSAIKDLMK